MRLEKLFPKTKSYYTHLLLFLVLLFVFRPYDKGFAYLALWKFFLTIALVFAVLNCKSTKHLQKIAFALAIPVFILSWVGLAHKHHTIFVADASFTILFLLVCVSSVVYDVVLKAKVTLETLKGVICAYFMVAILFAYIFYLIEFLLPGSFYVGRGVSVFSFIHFLSEMMYFSFVTLLTIGYGDVVPIRELSQTAAVIEGIIGQFYIAILVSRLVAVYTLSPKRTLVARKQK